MRGGHAILRDLTLNIAEKRVGIIGRNGSGKSSFVRLLNGLVTPDTGTIQIGDLDNPRHFRRQVGFVFQNPDNQIVYPQTREDIEFGLKNMGLERAEIARRVDLVMQRFGLTGLADRMTHELSGGEKQLVALAGVMVMEPRLIVFDEPTTLLDHWNKAMFMQTVALLDQPIVMVSHDLELLSDFDRVIWFEDGAIAGDGPPDEIIAKYLSASTC
jgi:biotin transport system ATP-binding protein